MHGVPIRRTSIMMRVWICCTLAALLCALLLPVPKVVAGESETSAEDFERELHRVDAISWRNRSRHGLRVLKTLLKEHAGKGYVLARRADIEDLMLRLAFGVKVEIPRAQDVVTGRIKSWVPRTGKLKIVYTPQTAGDLEPIKSFFYHPARFRGPVMLEIQGGYQPPDTSQSAVVIFGGDEERASTSAHRWRISFGCEAYDEGADQVWLPATVHHMSGKEETKIFEKDMSPMKCYARYKIKVKVDDRRIVVHVNSRKLTSFKKESSIFGSLMFRAPMWKRVTFTGEIEPSWIQSRIDAAIQAQREAFEKTYDPRDHLPAWLLEAPRQAQAPEERRQLPTPLADEYRGALDAFYEAVERGDKVGGLRIVEQLAIAGAPHATCEYLRALVYSEAEDDKRALRHVERVIALAPDFLESRLLLGRLLQNLGRGEEAAVAFETAAGSHGTVAAVYEAAVLTFLLAGRTEAARKFCSLAAGRSVQSAGLTLLAQTLAKAERGPVLTQTYESKSRHYHVVSDIDKKTCIDAARLLEDGYSAYGHQLGRVTEGKKRLFRVYVFRGKAGFLNYLKDLSAFMGKPSEKAAGLYSPLLKQLLIWNLPNRKEMLDTIRHEGSHQFLDRLLIRPPVWLNEGLAVYHELAARKGGVLTFGRPHVTYVQLLLARGLVPLAEFLRITPRKFYAGGHRSYAQAWLMVQMLRRGSKGGEVRFRAMIDAMRSRDGAEVAAELFPAESLASLDKTLRAYLMVMNGGAR